MIANKSHRRRVTMDAYSAVKNLNQSKRSASPKNLSLVAGPEAPAPITSEDLSEKNLKRAITLNSVKKRKNPLPWSYKVMNMTTKETLTAETALQKYGNQLSDYEKREIWSFQHIAYLGHDLGKIVEDYTDDEGFFKGKIGDQVGYRYEIVGVLGKGNFSEVFDCLDHKSGNFYAIKILRNNDPFKASGVEECRILGLIKSCKCPDKGINFIFDHFEFKEHICIVLEKLSENLADFQFKIPNKRIPLDLVATFTKQILRSINFIHGLGLIHCDLKPDNIMFRPGNCKQIEIIDFNSACEVSRKTSDYVQSRPYRAPEIVIDLEYTNKIDMWSVGCIVLEMITGEQIFTCDNENELFKMYIEVCGHPKRELVSKGRRSNLFIDRMGKFKVRATGKVKSIDKILQGYDNKIVDFVDRLLRWDPEERMTALQAIRHEWILSLT